VILPCGAFAAENPCSSIRQVQNGGQNDKKVLVMGKLQTYPSFKVKHRFGSMHAVGEVSMASGRPNPSIAHCDVNSSENVRKPGKNGSFWHISRAHESLDRFSYQYHKHRFARCLLAHP
jgi:hypothetical protein